MQGGYAMIDCSGLDLTSSSEQTIEGIFEQVETAYKSGKAAWAHNCTYDDGVLSPVPVMILSTEDRYCITSSVLQVWVTAQDECTIISMID